jgi:DHA1 family bicyclomycin/chloramphenicol resistance-like MFS transporter
MHPALLGRSYLEVFGSRAFLLLSLGLGLNFGGFFLYVLSAPVFLIRDLGLSGHEFGWLFVPAVGGMMLGSFLSGHLAGRLSTGRTLAAGYGVMILAAIANLAVATWLPPGLPQSVLPIALYNLGMALTMPSLTLLALDLFPARRGLASSCQSFLQSALISLSSGIVVPLLWGSPLHLALGMAAYLALGLGAAGLYRNIRD